MNLIRKHKISLITNEPLSGRDKEIIDFIEDKLSGLIPFKHDDYPDSVFFMKDGKALLEQDSKNNHLWCRYEDFWEVLSNDSGMVYDDIQTSIKYMVEQAFKQQVGTPISTYTMSWKQVEQAFKQQVGTPLCLRFSQHHPRVEQAFKQQVGTPITYSNIRGRKVEQAFKQQVGTPLCHSGKLRRGWNKLSNNR